MIMICKECGNEIISGTLFCTNCGAKAEAPEQEADSDKTVVLWDEEPQQPKQDDDKTVVLWDEEPQQSKQDDDKTVVLWDEEPQQPKQDDDKTVVLWDDEPQSQSQGSTAPKKCPNCGSENMGDALFCVECGALMSETKPQPVTPPPAAQPSMTTPPPAMEQQGKSKKEKAKKQPKAPKQEGEEAKDKKLPIIIGAAAAVVVVIIGAIFVMGGLSSKSAGDGRLVYLKDDEFYMAKRSSFQPELITDSFFEDDDNADSVRGMWDVDEDEDLFQYTEDGKYLFYPQDSDDYGGVFDLYYKKAGSKEEGTKLESGISSYHVCSADKILYVKSDKLYLASLKGEKEKLASDVDDDYSYDYGTSENGQYIFWYDEDENYYVQDMNLKKEKVKIKDVSYVVDISKDMKEIYYMSDDTLYVMKNLKDKVKIASDVDRFYMLGEGDNKKLYYTTLEDDTPYTYADLVKNDVKKDSEYYEYADEILENLEDCELNVSEYKAYTYSAATGKSEEVAGFVGEKGIIWGNDGDCMAYYLDIDIDACDKLKLSDVIDDFYFGNSSVMHTVFDYYWKEQADFYLLTADKRIPVAGMQEFYEKPGMINVRDFALNSVTKEVYMPVWYSAEDGSTYDLYVIPYTDKEVECRLITNDLYNNRLWQSEQGITYLCDVDKDGEEGTLFLNGIELAKDVYPGYIRASEDALYYIKDINSDHDEGTLYMNKNGKETEIAEDVASSYYGVLSDGSVAYLADYSYKKYKGDLFVFTGRKSIAVDEDVAAVILY